MRRMCEVEMVISLQDACCLALAAQLSCVTHQSPPTSVIERIPEPELGRRIYELVCQ